MNIILKLRAIFTDDTLEDFDYVIEDEFICLFINDTSNNENQLYEKLSEILNDAVDSKEITKYRLSKKFCETKENGNIMSKYQEYIININ